MKHVLPRLAVAALGLQLIGSSARADDCSETDAPLARAHAHNDYAHDRPLLDALDNGFSSVEADIWLVDGALLVAHDLEATQPERTLEALYLNPLAERVRANGGVVHPCSEHSLQLLIDIKSEGAPTYRALHKLLARYADILSTFTWDNARERAVTVVISGNRPLELMARQRVRFAAYDGRSSDISTDADAAFIPLVSDNWTKLFTWTGTGAMPEAEHKKLQDFVNAAHQRDRRVRFWATPEDPATREAVWTVLIDAGVDYINTDDLAGLSSFLLAHDSQPSTPVTDWFGDLNEWVER